MKATDNVQQAEHVPLQNHNEAGLRRRRQPAALRFPSSLDFERVVNEYSIQATRERLWELDDDDDNMVDDSQRNFAEEWSRRSANYGTLKNKPADQAEPSPRRPRPSFRRTPKPSPLGYTGRTATRWALTIVVGIMTGLLSILLVSSTERIQTWRSSFVAAYWSQDHKTGSIFFSYAAVNMGLALVSAALCLFLAPTATGSGIPEVKAYLNGVRVRRFSSARLFFVKIVATILSVSSGLAIGPEGPLVHLGAIAGASCTKVSNLLLYIFPHSSSTNRLWTFLTMDLAHFATDAERRDLVSMGAAAGFAAAFGAPIGGLLFAMEEASSYVECNMFLKTLVCTSIATFCLAIHHGDLSKYSIIDMGDFYASDQNIFLSRVEEVPFFLFIGAAGGVLGGVFCKVWKLIQLKRQQLFPQNRNQTYWKLLEVGLLSFLTSTLIYFVPKMSWACRPVNQDDDLVVSVEFMDRTQRHEHQFDCQIGEVNELAAIFFGSREAAIAEILSEPEQFSPKTLWVTGALFYFLMVFTLGVSIPSGIFMPTFLVGSSLGGAAGMVFEDWIGPELSPSTFALLGAAALLTGIQRSTVSVCVILVEGTGQVKMIIPVIITVVTARYVGDLISHHGLYETAILEVRRYPYLERKEKKAYDVFTVAEIMTTSVITLRPFERVETLTKLLRATDHNGFPVVDPATQEFVGLVRRDQLVALLEFGVFEEEAPTGKGDSQFVPNATQRWKSTPGISQSPLLHLAYHIKDDRYEHVNEKLETMTPPSPDEEGDEDAYDTNAWISTVRNACEHLDDEGDESVAFTGNDDLPLKSLAKGQFSRRPSALKKNGARPIIAKNYRGSLYIEWMDPAFKNHWVSIAAVMNRGTYTVSHNCPVSKAHFMFTRLGLRHLIVLGVGGRVVGIVTRINLLKESIEERTGVKF